MFEHPLKLHKGGGHGRNRAHETRAAAMLRRQEIEIGIHPSTNLTFSTRHDAAALKGMYTLAAS